MSTIDYLICPECGARNAEGPLCSHCGKSIVVTADQLPGLLNRRLQSAGFVELAPTAADSQTLDPLTRVFERTAEPDCQSLLTFPSLLSQPHSIHVLYVVAIAKGSDQTADGLRSFTGQVLTQAEEFLELLEKPRILVVQIRVYIVYSESLSQEYVRAHRLPFRARTTRVRRKRLSVGSLVLITFIPIDCKRGKAHFARWDFEPDRQATAALRQLQELCGKQAELPFFKKYIRLIVIKPLELFRSYVERMNLLGETEVLAHQIASGSMNAKQLYTSVLISAGLAALVAEILGVDIDTLNVTISALNKIVDGLIVMIMFLICAAFTHFPLRLAGGRASFRSTFVATVFLSAVTYPIVVGLVGVEMKLGMAKDEAWSLVQMATIGISVQVLSAVHGLSWLKTLLVLTIILPAALAIIAIAIITLFAV